MQADPLASISPFAARPGGASHFGSGPASGLAGGLGGGPGNAVGSDLRSGTRAQLGTSSQADFASILGIQNRVANSAGNGAGAEDARKVAEEFVAKVFIEPVFKQMRESNQTPPPFGPGQGEKQFSSLIDAQRALELVRSASWPIVDRLAADMTRKPAAGSPVAGEKAIGTNDIDIRKSVPASDTPAQLGFSALRG